MTEISQPKAHTIHYVKLNPVCAYAERPEVCGGPVAVIRVTHMSDNDVRVSTMCTLHAQGEQKHCVEEGLTMAGRTQLAGCFSDAILVDLEVMEEMKAAAREMLLAEQKPGD